MILLDKHNMPCVPCEYFIYFVAQLLCNFIFTFTDRRDGGVYRVTGGLINYMMCNKKVENSDSQSEDRN